MLGVTLLCGLGFALLVVRYDMYEREPWYLLTLALVLGGGAYLGLSYGEDFLLAAIPGGPTSTLAQSTIAGVAEEAGKLLVVLLIWYLFPQHFNDPFDGLMYGAMAGLGFAVGESVFYIQLAGKQAAWLDVWGQESIRLLLHLLLGGISCMGLGLARFRIRRWPLLLLSGVAAAMLLHFLWDYFCGLVPPSTDSLRLRILAVALMLTALGLFGTAVLLAQHYSRLLHCEIEPQQIWGWPFTK